MFLARRLAVTLLLLVTLAASPAPGPLRFTAQTLDGRSLHLPDAAGARRIALVIGASQASSPLCKTWAHTLHDAAQSDERVYAIIRLDKVPRLVRGFVTHSIAHDLERAEHRDTVLIGTDGTGLRAASPPGSDDVPVVLVLDASGTVLASLRARPEPEAIRTIEDALAR